MYVNKKLSVVVDDSQAAGSYTSRPSRRKTMYPFITVAGRSEQPAEDD